jgi:hypothetical protein
MWWSSGFRSLTLAAALAAAALPLAGCSFSPVYGGAGAMAGQQVLALNYAKPTTRLEQIVYQELRLRLGASEAHDAPRASVSVSASAIDPSIADEVNLYDTRRVTVTATLTITRPGEARPRTYTRVATADYIYANQVLASRTAADEAAERAALSAAESLRLAVLADLSR